MKLKEFFYFPKSDRSVLLLLIVVSAILLAVIHGLGGSESLTSGAEEDSVGFSNDERGRQGMFRRYGYAEGYGSGFGDGYYAGGAASEGKLVTFDPNTADSTTLLGIGLSPWQVRNIYKYRARGGVYRTPRDFAKLYGLTQKQYLELEPYIKISDDYRPAAELYAGEEPPQYERDTTKYPLKLKPGQYVMLNRVDTTQLKKVPGIGSYYASKITKYGQRLGGYVSVAQLHEVEGVPDEAFPYFKVDTTKVKKLNLNTLTLAQLKAHPYIDFFQARAICDYRRMYGPLKSLEDLSLMKEFPPQVRHRLQPYVTF